MEEGEKKMKEFRFTAIAARNIVIMADSEEEAKQIAENKCGVWLDIESTDKAYNDRILQDDVYESAIELNK